MAHIPTSTTAPSAHPGTSPDSTAAEVYFEAARVWNPNKVDLFQGYGLDIVFAEREGYQFRTADGRTLINMHLNGGVFNLGHRNPEVREALINGTERYDAGNHYFPSPVKNELCEALLASAPPSMRYVFFNNGGGESIDAAIKFAWHATGRKRVISVDGAFHGATGLATLAGSSEMAEFFHMTPDPQAFTKVPYNDLAALQSVLELGDTACIVLESIPATAGFPLPDDGYLAGVAELARRHGALYIADEVQTGLMRSGTMWCAVGYGAEPDMIVTGKGLSGGFYPMSAVIMNERSGAWLKENGFAHLSSFSGSELGCVVSAKVMEITGRQSTRDNVDLLTGIYAEGLAQLRARHPDFFIGVRQRGVIMGLETSHPHGSTALMKALYANGIWAMRANFDQSVLQFKAGLLLDRALAEKTLDILDDSLRDAAADLGIERAAPVIIG